MKIIINNKIQFYFFYFKIFNLIIEIKIMINSFIINYK